MNKLFRGLISACITATVAVTPMYAQDLVTDAPSIEIPVVTQEVEASMMEAAECESTVARPLWPVQTSYITDTFAFPVVIMRLTIPSQELACDFDYTINGPHIKRGAYEQKHTECITYTDVARVDCKVSIRLPDTTTTLILISVPDINAQYPMWYSDNRGGVWAILLPYFIPILSD